MELVLGNGQMFLQVKMRDDGAYKLNMGGGNIRFESGSEHNFCFLFVFCCFFFFGLFRHQGFVYFVTLSYAYVNSTDTEPRKSTVVLAKRLTLQSCK